MKVSPSLTTCPDVISACQLKASKHARSQGKCQHDYREVRFHKTSEVPADFLHFSFLTRKLPVPEHSPGSTKNNAGIGVLTRSTYTRTAGEPTPGRCEAF